MPANPNWPTVVVEVNFSGSTWTDITSRVWEVSATRGKQYELDGLTAGKMDLRVDNSDGALTPGNGSSPYSPNVVAYKPIRIKATWSGTTTILWSGFIERYPQEWVFDGNYTSTPMVAVDIVAALNQKMFDRHIAAELVAQQGPLYWWPLEEVNGDFTPERVGGVYDAQVLTYGGQQQVTVGGEAGWRGTPGPLGLEGAGIAKFTPAAVGSASVTNCSIIRLLQAVNGQTIAFPTLPWSLQITIQTDQRALDGMSTILSIEDSGAGNQFIRMGISSSGNIWFLMKDSNAAFANSTFVTQLADGKPHTIMLEFSGVHPVLYFSVDDGGIGSLTSGNGSGWVFTRLIDVNLGAVWPRNGVNDASAAQAYGGLIGNVAWYQGQALVNGGTSDIRDVTTNGFNTDTSDLRVANIMFYSAKGGSYIASTGVGDAKLQGVKIGGKTAAQAISDTVSWENGSIFATGDGKLKFAPRRDRYYPTSALTLGGSTYPIAELALDYDTTHLVNQVQAGRTDGPTFTVNNATSQATFGQWTKQYSDMGVADDNQSIALAQYISQRYANPQMRVRKVKLDPAAANALWPLVAGTSALEINQCITVNHTPLAGIPVSVQCWIESITYKITNSSFTVEMDLSPVDTNQYLVLNDATKGALGTSPYVLAF